jgi:outer membrane biosynthesis protein TonB
MAESTRPPPPKTGGGAFIAAAVVMLLLMGGLIYWKVKGEDEPKPVATTPPPVSAPPVFEAPPPPPPPIKDEPDAGKKVVRVGAKGVGGGACGGECKGTVPAGLNGALRAKAGAARGCYERALRQNAMLQGKIVVAVRVGAQGQVCSANIVSNSGDPGVASCTLGMFRSSALPPPNGGCVDVQVPMNFVPKTGPGT